MHRASSYPLLLVLGACVQVAEEPHPVNAQLNVSELDLGTVTPGVPPPVRSFELENTGASTVYVTPGEPTGDFADLVVVEVTPYSPVFPAQRKPLTVTLDDRYWLWDSVGFSATDPSVETDPTTVDIDLEVSYFFNGQFETEPDPQSTTQMPERITKRLALALSFRIDCDFDNDGFDAFACGGMDCDDDDPDTHPDADEICDGFDNDCDIAIDEFAVDRTTWYLDADNDGFGREDRLSCTQPGAQWRPGEQFSGDCDDTDPAVSPGRAEACFDLIDNDCDALIDQLDPDCQD